MIKVFRGPEEVREGYPQREWLEWSSEDHTPAGLYDMAEQLLGPRVMARSSGLDILQRHPERFIRIPRGAADDDDFEAEVLAHFDGDEIFFSRRPLPWTLFPTRGGLLRKLSKK